MQVNSQYFGDKMCSKLQDSLVEYLLCGGKKQKAGTWTQHSEWTEEGYGQERRKSWTPGFATRGHFMTT